MNVESPESRHDRSDDRYKSSINGIYDDPEGKKSSRSRVSSRNYSKERRHVKKEEKDYYRRGDRELYRENDASMKEKNRDCDRDRGSRREKWKGDGEDHHRDRWNDRENERDRYRDVEYDTEVSRRDLRKENSRKEKGGKERDRDRGKEVYIDDDIIHDYDKRKEKTKKKTKDKDDLYYDDMEREKSREKRKERERCRDEEYTDRSETEMYREDERIHNLDRDSKKKKRKKEREEDVYKEERRERSNEKGYDREKEVHRADEVLNEEGRENSNEKEWEREMYREKANADRDKRKERERDEYREELNIRYRERGREKSKERRPDKEQDRNVVKKDVEMEIYSDEENEKKRYRDVDDVKNDEKEENNSKNIDENATRNDYKLESIDNQTTVEMKARILRMKEERLKSKYGGSEILSWVSKSRKIEEKSEKDKAYQMSKVFEEQDNMNEEDDISAEHTAGMKVLHGMDKVIQGGAVVLTLKDQNVLVDGDLNEGVDMLENVEIGEQIRRDEAYKAAKKRSQPFDDKFDDPLSSEKRILPQYDEPVAEEGLVLDARGRFSVEAEKKLEELRRRIEGSSSLSRYEDLTATGKVSSEYYTEEEMVRFETKKTKNKKKKCMRRREKLDVDALEAEAVASGLGRGDLGSRNDERWKAAREVEQRRDVEMKRDAYVSAYTKADEESRALWPIEEDVEMEEDDHYRRISIMKGGERGGVSGPEAVALLASRIEERKEIKVEEVEEKEGGAVVLTEMKEFIWGLQLDEDTQRTEGVDVFMEEAVDAEREPSDRKQEGEEGGWEAVKKEEDEGKEEGSMEERKMVSVKEEGVQEPEVGKGLSGALKLLQDRGTLKETVEWGGRNMDKKKSKLIGIYDENAPREIRIDRTDEFGRILTPKEAFRIISHKFHGKGPGKMKQEKRMKQYKEEVKLKQMKNSDTPSLSVERMREAQARHHTPYLVLSGHVKPGEGPDSSIVDKAFPGSLTPMLGDRKVEHFLGIKRKAEGGNMRPPKKEVA